MVLITQHGKLTIQKQGAHPDASHKDSWACIWANRFFYNASKAALIGLSESMYYGLGLLDNYVVLASPGINKIPLLEKITQDGVQNVQALPKESRAFYKPYFDHDQTLSERSRNSAFFPTANKIARKLFRIVEKKTPAFNYNLAIDKRMFKLNS